MARPTIPTQPASASLPAPLSDHRLATGLPRLSVVVVNYRQWERTAELVRQLQASACVRRGDAEVVIVDNHSPPHPAARRLRRQTGVSVRRWEANHGFARAVNEGCRLSQGEWFLLLNPDTTLSEGFLDGVLDLAGQLAAEPRAGIVGFHLRNTDGSQQLSAGPFPTLASTVCRLLLPRSRRKYQAPRAPKRSCVPWVTGCCMLMRRSCVQVLPLLRGRGPLPARPATGMVGVVRAEPRRGASQPAAPPRSAGRAAHGDPAFASDLRGQALAALASSRALPHHPHRGADTPAMGMVAGRYAAGTHIRRHGHASR